MEEPVRVEHALGTEFPLEQSAGGSGELHWRELVESDAFDQRDEPGAAHRLVHLPGTRAQVMMPALEPLGEEGRKRGGASGGEPSLIGEAPELFERAQCFGLGLGSAGQPLRLTGWIDGRDLGDLPPPLVPEDGALAVGPPLALGR
jgi:hypothetical protein